MLNGKRICVVLPAYNAAETLEITYNEIPFDIVDDVVVVDDASKDATTELGKKLGIKYFVLRSKSDLHYIYTSAYHLFLPLFLESSSPLQPDKRQMQ